MRWDEIIQSWTERLLASPLLVDALGGVNAIYPAQAYRPVRVPSLEYLVTYDREEETFNRIGVQVDLFVRGTKPQATLERVVRHLTHHDVAQDLAGERLWLRFLDARTIEFPSDREVVHRVLDFEFTALREQYAA